MIPQSSFLFAAPVAPQREAELRRQLASMNRAPGVADPANALIPFHEFNQLHFARLFLLNDPTLEDLAAYNLPLAVYPTYLVFSGNIDGGAGDHLDRLVEQAGPGLRTLFRSCDGFTENLDLREWLREHAITPAASYVNWIGRTVRQVREEDDLRRRLESFLQKNAATLEPMKPRHVRHALKSFVAAELRSGRLTLSPRRPTPIGWQLRNFVHLIAVPLLLLAASPLLLLYLPFFLIQLRARETTDPVIAPRVDPLHVDRLAAIENHDVVNQFTAFGSLKPGRFRRWTMIFLLWIIDYTARHIYNSGGLARVSTIHFARWVFFDDRRRVLFTSDYDGSLESYMDDFINKVGFGLNVVFSNGIGYPRTDWLVSGGAKDEQTFKRFLRRHQSPTEVWYNANPGLTASDKHRNGLIRDGIDRTFMTGREVRAWLRLF